LEQLGYRLKDKQRQRWRIIVIITKGESIQYFSFLIFNCCSTTFSLSYIYSKIIHIFFISFFKMALQVASTLFRVF
jgi:hypothetical protein